MKKLPVIRDSKPSHDDAASTSTRPLAGIRSRSASLWSSLADKRRSFDEKADGWREFPKGAEELELDGVSRRRFVGIMGSSAALAGMSVGATGCIRKPKEHILPFAQRPEDMIPGKPEQYATAIQMGESVEGILVESHDGRPTKIAGNPKHSGSRGSTSVYTQASILDIYDPDRSRVPVHAGEASTMNAEGGAIPTLGAAMAEFEGDGTGLALVLPTILSPTDRTALRDLAKRFPNAKLFLSDPLAPTETWAAAELMGGEKARVRFSLDRAKVVFLADCDPFGVHPDATRLAREWSMTRRVEQPSDPMSRLYVVEPHLTHAGVMADHRMRVKSGDMGNVLLVLAEELAKAGSGKLRPVPGLDLAALPKGKVDDETRKLIAAAAADLVEHATERTLGSAVMVGWRQPAAVQALGLAINAALGNVGKTVHPYTDPNAPTMGSLADLAKGLGDGSLSTVVAVNTNPVYDATADLGLKALLEKATLWHFGAYRDETGIVADWHVPISHFLESWGDIQSTDGTVTIRQPLIEPLHGTMGQSELLLFLASGTLLDGYSVVRSTWMQIAGSAPDFDKRWRRWLHDGVSELRANPRPPAVDLSKLGAALGELKPAEGFEVDIRPCPTIADGRFANNAWMQELPHPVTKLTWDNAAYLSPAAAASLGVSDNDMVAIKVGDASVELPVVIAPGQHDEVVTVCIGYGRTITPLHKGGPAETSNGAGFDVAPVRTVAAPWVAQGDISKAGGSYKLVNTQNYGLMKPTTGNAAIDERFQYDERPIVLEMTQEDFTERPTYTDDVNIMSTERLNHLWEPPEMEGPQQWAMSIDLSTCTGCNACVIACQAENNIPVVGKEQVANGREMHWMRIDRYYRGDENNPSSVLQPMACQHCESAPCETVCPVAATVHSPEGLNDMAYNRCIGTRYCSNNCPYKVRRYNFFQYNADVRATPFWNGDDIDGAWLRQMQKNPDVTLRFRGVMEKCTYCVQRINQAKIAAHVAGENTVKDGVIVTACQEVCPTQAIVFGDKDDPESAIAKVRSYPHQYQVLRDLNTRPRTTYLAHVRNTNPKLPRPIPEMLKAQHGTGHDTHGGSHGDAHGGGHGHEKPGGHEAHGASDEQHEGHGGAH